MQLVDQRYEQVDPGELSAHPDNPNRGDVDSIADSIRVHGFYGVVLAQRSTGRIVAGEHRWRAARQEGADTVPVVWLDVDDDQARRIMVADNRHAALAVMDDEALLSLLNDFEADGGLDGIGFAERDLVDLSRKLAPPDLDDLADEVGEPSPEDFWPVVRVKVPPEPYAAWQELVEACDGDEQAAFVHLLDQGDS